MPDGDDWLRELKFDGYRAIAIKTGGNVQLRSRNDNDMVARYPVIAKALAKLLEATVVDGELAALDADGRPSYNLQQNYGKLHWATRLFHLRCARALEAAGQDLPFVKHVKVDGCGPR